MQIPFNAPVFDLRGVYTGRLVSIHDGDTFTCVIPLLDTFYKFSIRLAGIDTCEMTSKDPKIKNNALMARDRLFSLFTSSNTNNTISWTKKDFERYLSENYITVSMNCKGSDKYGRVLAEVSNFSDVLVREKLAYRYDGGTKLSETEILERVVSDT